MLDLTKNNYEHVGLVTARASGLLRNLLQASPKILFWGILYMLY